MARPRKILWTTLALDDLRSIQTYVSVDSPLVAQRLAARLKRSVARLSTYPFSGRGVPEFPGSPLREVVVSPYRIIYQLSEREVIILRVWHGRRNLER